MVTICSAPVRSAPSLNRHPSSRGYVHRDTRMILSPRTPDSIGSPRRGKWDHEIANSVHGPPTERSESEDPPATAARGALTVPRSSSPPLPPPSQRCLPLLVVPSLPPRGPQLFPTTDRSPSGAPCFSRPHHRPFHPRPHPTLRSSRESFFLASRPSRLLWRCVSRPILFFPCLSISFSFSTLRISRPIRLTRSRLSVCPRFLRNDTRRVSSDYLEDIPYGRCIAIAKCNAGEKNGVK